MKYVDRLATQAISTSDGVFLMAAPFALIFIIFVMMAYAHVVHVTGKDPVADLFGAILVRWTGRK